MRDRESMFSEFIVEIRRQEETDSRGQIERVSNMTVIHCMIVYLTLDYSW